MRNRNNTREKILKIVQANPQVTMQALLKATHMGANSNIQYHLKKLAAEGLIDSPHLMPVPRQRPGGEMRQLKSDPDLQASIDAVVAKAEQQSAVSGQPNGDVVRGSGWILHLSGMKASRVG